VGPYQSLKNAPIAGRAEDLITQPRPLLVRSRQATSWRGLSSWTRSPAKRLFDCACVILAFPVLAPLMLVIAIVVRLTSSGPVLFLQERMGRSGQKFTIFKFRTMVHVEDAAHHPITTSENQRFTRVGPFLRRWKMDELPQLINVLLGDMSLVGPRPKMPQHALSDIPCRPGITGMATIVFACEERVLADVALEKLDAYYHGVVLPAKRQLDAEYMSHATFLSDLRLLVKSVLRKWDAAALDEILVSTAVEWESKNAPARPVIASRPVVARTITAAAERQLQAERAIS
jgi:lipopolysaccharide/colanic/teichoic acid biosynthesis glycosyltransferase